MLSGDIKVRGMYGWQLLSEISLGDANMALAERTSKTGRRYTFGLNKGSHSKKTWQVVADRPQLWTLANGDTTYDLREGDVIPANRTDCGYSPEGWLHGYLKRQGFSFGVFKLYKPLSKWAGRLHQLSIQKETLSDRNEYTFPEFSYQKWPYELDKTYQGPKYLGSFVQGYMDGAKPFAQVAFSTSEAAWWFYGICPFGGYVASGVVSETKAKTEKVRIGSPIEHAVYRFYCVKGSDHAGFKLLQIDPVVGKGLYLSRSSLEPEPLCIEGGLLAQF